MITFKDFRNLRQAVVKNLDETIENVQNIVIDQQVQINELEKMSQQLRELACRE